jgi:hypothetical protein
MHKFQYITKKLFLFTIIRVFQLDFIAEREWGKRGGKKEREGRGRKKKGRERNEGVDILCEIGY